MGDVRRYAADAVRAASGFDVVHAELGGGTLAQFHAARAVVRASAAPVVLTLHDPPRLVWRPFDFGPIGAHRSLRAASGLVGGPAAARLERAVARRARAVAALSDLGAAAATQALGLARPALTLPWPADPIAPDAPGAEAAALGAASSHEPRATREVGAPLRLGFHGYWYGGKGLEPLLDAVGELTGAGLPVELRVFGGPPEGTANAAGRRARAALEAAVADRGLTHRVTVVGFIDDAHLTAALRACDAIVLPYATPRSVAGLRSVSSAAFDALGAGVPVVATDVRALREVIDHGVDGLVVPSGDLTALTRALRQLAQDPDRLETLRFGAQRRATAFGLDATGDAARLLYDCPIS